MPFKVRAMLQFVPGIIIAIITHERKCFAVSKELITSGRPQYRLKNNNNNSCVGSPEIKLMSLGRLSALFPQANSVSWHLASRLPGNLAQYANFLPFEKNSANSNEIVHRVWQQEWNLVSPWNDPKVSVALIRESEFHFFISVANNNRKYIRKCIYPFSSSAQMIALYVDLKADLLRYTVRNINNSRQLS